MITDFGLCAFLKDSQKTEGKLSPSELATMENVLDSMLMSMPNDTMIEESDTFIHNGTVLKYSDVIETISPHIGQIKLASIKLFEAYFSAGSNSKDPTSISRDFSSGAENAKRVLRRMCIFPIEAMNVRLELAHPQLLQFNARKDKDKARAYIIVGAIGDDVLAKLEGPHLPPIPINSIIEKVGGQYEKLDHRARAIISGNIEGPNLNG
jgi:hypothetical protein